MEIFPFFHNLASNLFLEIVIFYDSLVIGFSVVLFGLLLYSS